MDLDYIKKYRELGPKKDGGYTKYGFNISKEMRNLRQRNFVFELYKEIKEIKQKNDGGLTKYKLEFNKEIKTVGVEKSWCLNKVWIWIV